MVNYIIYHLYFDNFKQSYIGLTSNYELRKKLHISCCTNKSKQKIKLYNFISSNNLKNKIKFEKLDEFECDTVQEAKQMERTYIECIEPTLNSSMPTRTKKEYFNKFKSEIYRKRNIENLKKREKYKQKSLNYYYKHHEERKRKHKEYLLTDKGKQATANRKRNIVCVCGCPMVFSSHRVHKKTIWHNQTLLKLIQEGKQKLKYSFKNIDIRI